MQLFLGSLTDWITHISANSIILMIMMIFMVIGGVDYIRGNKLGYGHGGSGDHCDSTLSFAMD